MLLEEREKHDGVSEAHVGELGELGGPGGELLHDDGLRLRLLARLGVGGGGFGLLLAHLAGEGLHGSLDSIDELGVNVRVNDDIAHLLLPVAVGHALPAALAAASAPAPSAPASSAPAPSSPAHEGTRGGDLHHRVRLRSLGLTGGAEVVVGTPGALVPDADDGTHPTAVAGHTGVSRLGLGGGGGGMGVGLRGGGSLGLGGLGDLASVNGELQHDVRGLGHETQRFVELELRGHRDEVAVVINPLQEGSKGGILNSHQ